MILVVGATGTLGGMIATRLLAEGRRVRILVRPNAQVDRLIDAGAQPVPGDLTDPPSLASACQGIETVITTANSIKSGGDPELIDYQGNCNLIDAAKTAGVKQFIFLSVAGAALDSPSLFVACKARAEQYLINSGLDYTIIAPGAFAETWLGMVVIAPALQGLPVRVYGYACQAFPSILDVTNFSLAAIRHPAAHNLRLTIGGPEAISFAEAAEMVSHLLRREVPVELIPANEPLPGIPEPLLPILVSLSQNDWFVPMDDLARIFNVCLTPPEEALRTQLIKQRELMKLQTVR